MLWRSFGFTFFLDFVFGSASLYKEEERSTPKDKADKKVRPALRLEGLLATEDKSLGLHPAGEFTLTATNRRNIGTLYDAAAGGDACRLLHKYRGCRGCSRSGEAELGNLAPYILGILAGSNGYIFSIGVELEVGGKGFVEEPVCHTGHGSLGAKFLLDFVLVVVVTDVLAISLCKIIGLSVGGGVLIGSNSYEL